MSIDDPLRSDINRGMKAAALLREELLVELFATLESEYTQALLNTPVDASGQREMLYLAVHAVRKLPHHLQRIADQGKLASQDLKDLTEGRKPKAEWHTVR